MCNITTPAPININLSLQDKSAPRRMSNNTVARAMQWLRSQVRGVPAPTLIWTLIACSTTFCLLQGLRKGSKAGHIKLANEATIGEHTEKVADGSLDDCGKPDVQQSEEEEDMEEEEDEGEEKDTITDDEMIMREKIGER